MAIEVRIPTILRTYTGGEKAVQGQGGTLSALIEDLEANHPGIKDRLVDNGDLRRFRDAHYVWVKVNASDEKPNTAFFAQFPEMERDYPRLLVLDADGSLLVSQATGELRRGEAF